jgi:hypothetical protein
MGARPFHGQKHRPAPLPADANALHGAQDGQDHGPPDADRLVGRHEGDEEGRNAHTQERGDQRGFAADAVAVVAEDRCPDGAGGEADEEGAEGEKSARVMVFVRKEELAEDEPGRRAIKKEIVPLDGCADRRGDDCLT